MKRPFELLDLIEKKELESIVFNLAGCVNGILKTADYRELKTAIYGGGKYPLMSVMDIPYEL